MMALPVLTSRDREEAPGPLWWLVTGAGAVLLLTVAVPVNSAVYNVPLLLAFLASTAQCAALALALVRPRTATAVQFAAASAIALGGPVVPDELWPLPVTGILALTAHIAIIGIRQRWAMAVLTWWASAFLSIALVVLDPRGRGVDFAGNSLIIYTSNSVLVLVASIAYQQRGRVRRQLSEARRDVELEQSRRVLVEERTRIARELHDVVAHSMSVIHMQAASARYRLPALDPAGREEMTQIARAAKDAMQEMRQILTVLRDTEGDAATQPVPDLSQLRGLAENAERAGSPTRLDLAPDLDNYPIPSGVALAAYRIVQEALSNVVRHASGAPVRVEAALDVKADALMLTITNGAATEPAPQNRIGVDNSSGRIHLGLIGMRERANLLHGSLTHRPRPDGGYEVTARLPLHEARPAAPAATTTTTESTP